ncbi:hypothetical protein ACS5PU_23515 [Pedobacter sp. GSP4]|uniref:hypothetical protein n=1 Tax=Pedobacter sp. GSP4 TaxID=3453716 RepID=UPI003EEB13A9
MKAKIYLLVFVMLLFFGCKKPTNVDRLIDGNYTGVLVVTNSAKAVPSTYPITISLKNGRFNITPTGNTSLKPSGGSGSYSFKNGTAHFADENVWTADFDWNLILNGEYEIQSNATDLTLTKKFNTKTDLSPSTSYAYLDYKYILQKTD